MVSTKNTELFKALQPGIREFRQGAIFYMNEPVKGLLLSFPNRLEELFREFKIEFQNNLAENESEKYISVRINSFNETLKELERFKKRERSCFASYDAIPEEQRTIENCIKFSNELAESDYGSFEYLIECQIEICTDTIDYIKKLATQNNPNFDDDNILKPVVLDKQDIKGQEIEVSEKPNEIPKLNFNLSKVELTILFWTLENAGITDFFKQKKFTDFLETYCTFNKKNDFVEVSDVKTVLGKLRSSLPSGKSTNFPYDKTKDHLITEIEKGIDCLKEKMTFMKNELNMPSPINQDTLKKW